MPSFYQKHAIVDALLSPEKAIQSGSDKRGSKSGSSHFAVHSVFVASFRVAQSARL
jgi:hypothetical protein